MAVVAEDEAFIVVVSLSIQEEIISALTCSTWLNFEILL